MKIFLIIFFAVILELGVFELGRAKRLARQQEDPNDGKVEDQKGNSSDTTTSLPEALTPSLGNSKQSCDDGGVSYTIGNIRIPCSYSKLEIPKFGTSSPSDSNEAGPSITVEIDVAIRSIGEVDELNEEITVEMDFSAMWIDFLIFLENADLIFAGSGIPSENEIESGLRSLDPSFLDVIWKPDIFIENVIKFTRPSLMVSPMKVLFSPLGFVIVSTRLRAKLSCDMEFHYYPADTQNCHFIIRSYSHQSGELRINWNSAAGGVRILDRSDHNFDVQVVNVSKYILKTSEGLLFKNYSETYDVLHFTIAARRILSYHMIQTYLPSIFFILITWLCFLIPVTMVEARIGVAMTTLLTLTSMFSSVRESTPSVSHVRALDVWMVGCIIFVFSTLFEFTVLVFMRHVDDIESEESATTTNEIGEEKKMNGPDETIKSDIESDSFFVRLRMLRRRREKNEIVLKQLAHQRRKQAQLIERYAFMIFFLSFLIFNLIYWPWILIGSDYISWTIDDRYNP